MFVTNNSGFICLACGTEVSKHPTSSRDHCTNCLVSLHVDNSPGDRANPCQGLLTPIGLRVKEGKQQIAYRCASCHVVRFTTSAPDDSADALLALSQQPYAI